jgi:hypothetical protein
LTDFFTKPLNMVDANDVTALANSGWPESYTLEYKRSLPNKSGGSDPWDQGKNEIGDYARNELLAEIVGMANSDGGYLILGIDETTEKPPRPSSIVEQREVRDLARRFEDQARACIDPPISSLIVHPIETNGTSGVVVFKVSASRFAPHRVSTTRDAFVRRGASTTKMTMREIQDMSVASARRTDDLQLEFQVFRAKFRTWRGTAPIAFRVTAIPLDRLPDVGRLYNSRPGITHFSLRRFQAAVGQQNVQLVLVGGDWSDRPILRGVQGDATTTSGRFRIQHLQSGVIDLSFATNGQFSGVSDDRTVIYHGWLLGGVANVLQLISAHRQRVGMGDAEYGLEIEILASQNSSGAIPAYLSLGSGNHDQSQHFLPPELLLPMVSIGGPQDFDPVINIIDTDVFDALEVRRGPDAPIVVSW